jgi:hypothetical protein
MTDLYEYVLKKILGVVVSLLFLHTFLKLYGIDILPTFKVILGV